MPLVLSGALALLIAGVLFYVMQPTGIILAVIFSGILGAVSFLFLNWMIGLIFEAIEAVAGTFKHSIKSS